MQNRCLWGVFFAILLYDKDKKRGWIMDAKKIGSFIAEKRRAKKLTQMQMGEKLGVTAKTISRWENGNYMPDIALLIPIAELLDVTVNELLMGEVNVEKKSTETPFVSAIEYTKSRNSLLAKRYIFWFLAIVVCVVMAIFLIHVVLFNELGISGNILKEHFGFMDGGATMTNEMMNVVIVIFTVILLGIGVIGFSFWFLWENRKRNRLQGLTEGKIIGLLKSGLFKNKTMGEFPGGVLMGWGVGRGEQYWGGTLKMDIPPWFPCVRFEVDGKEYHVITGCGTFKDKWQLDQKVTILYNPENPRIAYLEGDDSYIIHHRIYFCFGVAVALLSALAYAILIM